ncbi:hypothetical protein Tco_0496597 [Tanacetum coccineum]
MLNFPKQRRKGDFPGWFGKQPDSDDGRPRHPCYCLMVYNVIYSSEEEDGSFVVKLVKVSAVVAGVTAVVTVEVMIVLLLNKVENLSIESNVADPQPSSWTHTVGGRILEPRDKASLCKAPTPPGCLCHTLEDEIMAIVYGGKQRGQIPGVGRVLPRQGTVIPLPSQSTHSADIVDQKKRGIEAAVTKTMNMFMRLFRSDDKFSQMLNQLESQPEYGGGSGSGVCEDDEPGDDEDGDEDEGG